MTTSSTDDAVIRYRHDQWGEEPRFPVADWKAEVANDETRLGYWEWAANQSDLTLDAEDPSAPVQAGDRP